MLVLSTKIGCYDNIKYISQKRIQKLISDLDIELLTLSDIPEKIDEPSEFGENAVEIAKNKAIYYWEATGRKMPALTQDDTMDFLGNVSPEDDPKTAIKEPVVKALGEYSIPNAIAYYSKLAERYGGNIDFAFRYGHGFVSEAGAKGVSSSLYAKLVKDPRGIDKVGKYPLRALTKLKIGNNYVYSEDATDEEKVAADSDIKRALVELLCS